MLVKKESTPRLPNLVQQILQQKQMSPFFVYSLLVKDCKIGTRNFANL